jgi:hypothetical protein
MRRPLYVLNQDGTLREATDKNEFVSFMDENNKKLLASEKVYNICEVITSFIGRDLSTKPRASTSPQLFETLVVGGVINGSQRTYATYQEALAGHQHITQLVRNNIH